MADDLRLQGAGEQRLAQAHQGAVEQRFDRTLAAIQRQSDLLEGEIAAEAQQDRIRLIYTDTSFSLKENLEKLSRYRDVLRLAAEVALEKEAILVAAYSVYQSG